MATFGVGHILLFPFLVGASTCYAGTFYTAGSAFRYYSLAVHILISAPVNAVFKRR